MAIELTSDETAAAVASLQRYFREEFEIELSEMRTKFLLKYILQEFGPFGFNRGVRAAEEYFRGKVEDLPSICFEDGLTYWSKKK